MKLASSIKSCLSLFVPVVSTTQPNFSPIATATTAVIVSPFSSLCFKFVISI